MAIFLNDTFTEASSTALGSHTPNTGSTWVQRNVSSGGTTRDMTVGAGTGTVTPNGGDALFTNAATPAGTGHYGEAVWTPSSASLFGVIFNWTAEGTFYRATLDRYNNLVYFDRFSSWSSSNPLGTNSAISLPNGSPGTIRYECTVEGSNKRLKLFFGGSELLNDVDTSPLSGVGLTGIQMDGGACTSIEAGDIGGGASSVGAAAYYYSQQ